MHADELSNAQPTVISLHRRRSRSPLSSSVACVSRCPASIQDLDANRATHAQSKADTRGTVLSGRRFLKLLCGHRTTMVRLVQRESTRRVYTASQDTHILVLRHGEDHFHRKW
ncbi:unnamed protein product [Ectocarpus sp. 8 AP-2014]